jgi:hypothetical protein
MGELPSSWYLHRESGAKCVLNTISTPSHCCELPDNFCALEISNEEAQIACLSRFLWNESGFRSGCISTHCLELEWE